MALSIGVRANFFPEGGYAIFARKMFRQRPKNCYDNLRNFFARLAPPNIIISENPGFAWLRGAAQTPSAPR